MSKTALQLIQTASKRIGDYIPSMPTAPGTTTQLYDSLLMQYLQTLTQANMWVYGTATADTLNRGVERRADAYTRATNTQPLSFPVAWPQAITTGLYEIHPRYQRSLILEWINDAVGQLGIYWYRQARDESIVTANLQMEYPISNSAYWRVIQDVQIQADPNSQVVGFPYVSADPWNWDAYSYIDPNGVLTWKIQFGVQPPPGRILRIFGEAFYPSLELDTDVLALSGQYEVPALSYIFDWVAYRAMEYGSLIGYTTDSDKYRQRMYDSLNRTKEKLISMLQPTHQPSQIGLPGRGSGLLNSWGQNNPNYFGILNTPGSA